MCKMEAAAGNKGSYGRQIVYKTLANAMVAPLVGVIMDKITAATGAVNYVAPFVICDVLLLCALVSLCFVDRDIGLPKTDTKKGVKLILTNVNIMVFLFMVLMCGVMFGFVETFLFVYLKVDTITMVIPTPHLCYIQEDLNAPIYLLGLTITTGALGKLSTKCHHASTAVCQCPSRSCTCPTTSWARWAWSTCSYSGSPCTGCATSDTPTSPAPG